MMQLVGGAAWVGFTLYLRLRQNCAWGEAILFGLLGAGAVVGIGAPIGEWTR